MTRRQIDIVLDAIERGETPLVLIASDLLSPPARAVSANHPSAQWRGRHLTVVPDDIQTLITDWREECGKRVARRREVFGLHRRELADLCGTTEPTIIRIEAGDISPKDSMRVVIAGVLRSEVAELWPYPSCERIHDFAQAVA